MVPPRWNWRPSVPYRRPRSPVLLAVLGAAVLLPSGASAGAHTYSIRAAHEAGGMAVFNLGSVRAAGIRSARLVARHRRAHRLSVDRIRRAANRGKLRLRLPRTWQARPLAGTRLSIVSRSGSVDTSITSGPTGTGYVTTATFGFSASENHSKFQCQLDAGAWSACSSPKAYAGLTVGNHVFAVRATDRWGHTDPTPATRSWSVALAVQPPPPPPPSCVRERVGR